MTAKTAQRFHVGEYIRDELNERGWSTFDCAVRMPGKPEINELALDILLAVAEAEDTRGVRLGKDMAEGLEQALGVSAETLLRLDEAYHEVTP